MAWDTGTSARASRLPSNWQTLRIRVLRRDRYRCQWRMQTGGLCLEPANQVDHITPGDDHRLEKLQALCAWHHARKSSAEGADARRARPRPSKYRHPEKHPGLL